MVQVIAHPETGEVITIGNNPAYGTFRVDSQEKVFKKGFMNIVKRTAFTRGELENLKSLKLKPGMVLPGKIIKSESFNPFYDGQTPKINPSTAEVVLTDGRPTYLEYEYTTVETDQDKWVDNLPEGELETAANAEESSAQQV